MTFDELQKRWKEDDSAQRVNIEVGRLLREVRRNKRSFEAAVFWRDVREVLAAVLVGAYFLYSGVKDPMWWSLILLGMLSLGVGAFFVVDRIIQKRRRPKQGDSFKSCVENSLLEIKHQIWLLRNVFWWYLLPIVVGVAIYTVHLGWRLRGLPGFDLVRHYVQSSVILCVLILGVYLFNQSTVRKALMPRKKELEELMLGLREDGTGAKH